MKKIPVGILGATGMVGQQYVQLLANHPWFEVAFLAASEQSAGKSYADAVGERCQLDPTQLPQHLWQSPVHSIDDTALAQNQCRFVFSAMTNEGAKIYEERYAALDLPVISNASYHRLSPDVPMLIPEVNPEHSEIIPIQRSNRSWKSGFIAVKPNCSLQSYMIPLTPLHQRFQVTHIIVTTLQAISGAGYPGVPSLDIIDNVVPHISGEEEKSEREPLKIWGKVTDRAISLADNIAISAHCNRVPVIDGHLACVSVKFAEKPSEREILQLWSQFHPLPQQLKLPSAPQQPIIYSPRHDRPQPRYDRTAGRGMSITVGRLRPCNIFDYRFVALSHNTIRGAAGGGILNAELLLEQGYLS